MTELLKNKFTEVLGEEAVLISEPMKKHTTFRIGGPCDIMLLPKSAEEIRDSVRILKENGIDYYIIGNGSNLLVSDKGFKGAIIKLSKNFSETRVNGCEIIAEAGAMLSGVSSLAAQNSLTGLEFASGIPGSVGGAVLMNAGAYGGEMKDVVVETEYLSNDLEIERTKEHGFSYRNSIFQENGGIILKTRMLLKQRNKDEINAEIQRLTAQRKAKQPLSYPSAGSAFKRPNGYFAAKLIDEAGLRGFSVGGAEVSELHTGFVINKGDATASDVLKLLDTVRDVVFEKSGVTLMREIKYIGD